MTDTNQFNWEQSSLTESQSEAIAIIGLSGRFPKASNLTSFWENLRDGVESITFFSDEELIESGIDPTLINHPQYVKAGTTITDADQFDAAFFGVSPREAEITDPQRRLFLECAWEALEMAGYDAESYDGLIGLYASVGINTYWLKHLYLNHQLRESLGDYQLLMSNDRDFLPTYVSYKLNLKGPSINIQTACSSSLVAVHLACQSLLNGECDMALAGGVNIRFPQKIGYLYQEGMIMSPDGHCRAFDAQAQGTIGGNGLGIVLLKRLEDAIADRDYIYALIKGSAINNDGSMKVGYTAPSIDGQASVISEALAVAGVEPETINYIEAHGTGTKLGDPIEIAALTQAFLAQTLKTQFCRIGSLKTNMGHLDAAAGVAGLIKTTLALHHKQIPPSLHYQTANPQINFTNSPFFVNTELTDWETDETPRRAGVSSFGIGGTNAHVVLEEAPPQEPSGASRRWQLLVLSAKTSSALETLSQNLVEHLQKHPSLNLPDITYTLSQGRRAFAHRRMVVCQSVSQALEVLSDQTDKLSGKGELNSKIQQSKPIIFMFSGQGSQYMGMGKDFYENEPIFRQQMDQCSEILKPILELDLVELIYAQNQPSEEETESLLKQTNYAQPALFAIEYSLATLWKSWGIEPTALIGHSIGEYVAACLAGVFSLEDGLRLVAERGKLMQKMPPGRMLSVPLTEEALLPFLNSQLSVAVVNNPNNCVVSGSLEAIKKLQEQLSEQNIESRPLHTSHAFHSAMMEGAVLPFMKRVAQVDLQPSQIPYISNVTGNWITSEQATDPAYYAEHLRQTVRFSEGLATLLQQYPDALFLEVGPGRSLTTLVKRHPEKGNEHLAFQSIRHPQDQYDDLAFLLNTLGQLWLAGVEINWQQFYGQEVRNRVPLPTYPFERQRYWIDAPQSSESLKTVTEDRSLPAKQLDMADWFYVPSWKRSALPIKENNKPEIEKSVLVFMDGCGIGSQIISSLGSKGYNVISIEKGKGFLQQSPHQYTLNPNHEDDYHHLLQTLIEQNIQWDHIVHLWSLTQPSTPLSGLENLDEIATLGLYSLIYLAKAIGKQNISDPLKITVFSNSIQEVTGEESICPEKATLLGAVKVIPQEYPNIQCASVDIILPLSQLKQSNLINDLVQEILTPSSELVIAYRGRYRWVQTFEPVRLEKNSAIHHRLKLKGVYLITGGLGGVGLTLAKYLAQTIQAKLILIGRSTFPEPQHWQQWLEEHDQEDKISQKITKLQELENLGSEVKIFSADIANEKQVKAIMAEVQQQWGEINGVIHCAGVADYGGIIQTRTKETTETVLTAKVKGTLVLDKLLKDTHLDFFVLCSSLATVLHQTKFGQVGYCAANDFLDAFAYSKKAQNRTYTVAINWWDWGEVGMSVDSEQWWAEKNRNVDKSDLDSLSPSEGVEIFERILPSNWPRVAISPRNLSLMRQKMGEWLKAAMSSQESSASSDITFSEQSKLETSSLDPNLPTEQIVIKLWQELLGVEKIELNDDFFELGGDSLLGLQLASKVKQTFNLELAAHTFIEHSTVNKIAQLIDTKLNAYQSQKPESQKSVTSSLVTLQTVNPQNRPLFLVHPLGGTVYYYLDLIDGLDKELPIYGFQSQGLDGQAEPLVTVEEMATHYLEGLQSVQDEGPYWLGGSSFGGVIAFEMAQRLQQQGQTVELLFMIDPPTPRFVPFKENFLDDLIALIDDLFEQNLLSQSSDKLETIKEEMFVALGMRHRETADRMFSDFNLTQTRYYLEVTKANSIALSLYSPKAYSDQGILFLPQELAKNSPENMAQVWQELVTGGLTIYDVPGDHFSMNFSPNVQVIIEILSKYLTT